MKGSDLLLISTYDSWTLLWNPDLIFLTSSNIEETNTVYWANKSVYGGKYGIDSANDCRKLCVGCFMDCFLYHISQSARVDFLKL